MKRLIKGGATLVMALALCLSMAVPAFAATSGFYDSEGNYYMYDDYGDFIMYDTYGNMTIIGSDNSYYTEDRWGNTYYGNSSGSNYYYNDY